MAAHPIEIGPRNEQEVRQAGELYRMLIHDGAAALIGPDGSKVELPPSVHDVFSLQVLEKMQEQVKPLP